MRRLIVAKGGVVTFLRRVDRRPFLLINGEQVAVRPANIR